MVIKKLILLICLTLIDSSFSQNNLNNPNFIFILADDQGWNGTSVEMIRDNLNSKSDFYETPNLERLSNTAFIFSNAYASAPVCAPSRYSIQFGKTPARLKMIRVGMNTNHISHNSELTIPKQLKKINSNYKTAHFGKWGMDSTPNILGYDVSDGATKNIDGVFNYQSNKLQWMNNIDNEDPKQIFGITQRAISFIKENKKNDTPFFLQISHYAIHSDIIAREKTYEKFKNKAPGKIHENIGLAAMTFDLDESIGLILDTLDKLDLKENTYIIYSSDNGSVPIVPPQKSYNQSYNFPLDRGKWDAKEGGIRVPFIVSGPGINSNNYFETPISFSDLLPTIVDLAGNRTLKDKSLDGGSFKKILERKSNKVKRNSEGLIFHVPYENKIAMERAHSAIIIDSMKLIKFHDNNEIKLFNLKNDLGEKFDLGIDDKKTAKKLENKLDNYLKKVKAPKWKPGINWKNKSLKNINSYH